MTTRSWSLVAGAAAGAAALVVAGFVPVTTPSCGTRVVIDVSSSTEKGDLIEKLAGDYNRARRVCAEVRASKKTSGATMDALIRGWDRTRDVDPEPQVWLPSSSLWAKLMEHRANKDLVSGEDTSITKSPLVIAMPRKMAEALGWPGKPLGWADLRALANERDWAKRGHPEWGRFAMGKDSPRLSTSGLAGTIATYYAATKDIGGFTDKNFDNADVLTFVRNVESSVAHYADDSVVFLGNLYAEDQKGAEKPYISAMVMQEQMAFLYNSGAPTGDPEQLGKSPRPKDPLVAIHPQDGTMMIDHPFLVMRSATAEQRAAAEDFRTYLLERQADFVGHGFRDVAGKASDALATSVGTRPDQALNTFSLPNPAAIDKMLNGWDAARRRGRVLLVLDVSGSMKEIADPSATHPMSKLELLKPAVQRGLQLLDDDDEVALWTFSSPGHTIESPMRKVGEVREQLAQIVQGLQGKQDTALYNTIHAAHEAMLADLDPKRINAIVVLTDGRNTAEGVTKEQLLPSIDATTLDSTVRVFTIAYGADADRDVLGQIAAASKARAYDASDPSNIDKVFVSAFSNF